MTRKEKNTNGRSFCRRDKHDVLASELEYVLVVQKMMQKEG